MNSAPDHEGTTLVTALFDVAGRERSTSRRTVSELLTHASLVLEQRQPLVCVCDPAIAPTVSQARASLGLAPLTLVVARPLEETRSWALLPQIDAARSEHPIENANPAKDTPLYAVCMQEKFGMIEEVARTNPFSTAALAWVDIGIAHVAVRSHVEIDRVFDTRRPRLRILQLRPWPPGLDNDLREYARLIRGYVAGGFLSGPLATMDALAGIASATFARALARGIALSDEQLLALTVDEHPELFAPFPGDYADILANAVVLRSGGANLRMQLGECLRLRDWEWAMEIGRAVREGLAKGSFQCNPATLSDILESLFVASWNAEYPQQVEATRVARQYASLVATSPHFRELFRSRRDEVMRNFAHLDAAIAID